jgi:serine/threonine protein kinase
MQVGFIFMSVFRPKKFGKYQLLDKIAVGGMAELYRAKLTGEQGFEKLIAIKKILPNLSEQENLVTSFIDEAKLAALLNHENIVQIYDFGSMDDEYFIAMEFLFGKDLRTIRRNAEDRKMPLGMEKTIYIVSRICAGLDYSHNLKDLQGQPLHIIHRDINPQNILVTYDGQVKIIDFGIAKAASHNNKTKVCPRNRPAAGPLITARIFFQPVSYYTNCWPSGGCLPAKPCGSYPWCVKPSMIRRKR